MVAVMVYVIASSSTSMTSTIVPLLMLLLWLLVEYMLLERFLFYEWLGTTTRCVVDGLEWWPGALHWIVSAYG